MVPRFSPFQKVLVGLAIVLAVGFVALVGLAVKSGAGAHEDARYRGDILPRTTSPPAPGPFPPAPVRAGASCSPSGAHGRTSDGTSVRCRAHRWRKVPRKAR